MLTFLRQWILDIFFPGLKPVPLKVRVNRTGWERRK